MAKLTKPEKAVASEKIISAELEKMFQHQSKLSTLVPAERISSYKKLYLYIKELQQKGEIPTHHNYLQDNELATDIYKRKYFLKDFDDQPIETCPEDVFTRLAAYMAAIEDHPELQKKYAQRYYQMLYDGLFLPGGRVIAGAGDLYRLKTLANCFVSVIQKDNIESIYHAAYECARTYSYGGGIGVDISNLRPKDSVVHNAANQSTGAVSFMELYSLTTGLIGQSGRRGALMLTLDVKHPDIFLFVDVKRKPNWVTKQIMEQCKYSGIFSEAQLYEIQRQVRENTQVRFANISVKVSDEFMQAVHEQKTYGSQRILVYKKHKKGVIRSFLQDEHTHYAYAIPSKDIEDYSLYGNFDTIDKLNEFLGENHKIIFSPEQLMNPEHRDIFGDYVIPLEDEKYDLAVKYAGDFMLYYGSKEAGEVKKLIKGMDVWNKFVTSNYKTAEPGIIFWSTMTKYSPSNYVGRPISSTNPCGEVPLEDGGACNLASINLSRFVIDGYTADARIDWKSIKETSIDLTRFMDNVISWNETLNPLEKQRKAAHETRRLGIGIMGIADMLNQLGIAYDSDEGIEIMGKITKFITNICYQSSALLAKEKGASKIFNFKDYSQCPFYLENLEDDTQELIKAHGLRNIALMSIAPTGTISNVILGYKRGNTHYIGVSGGVEPIFSLYYNRRSESFGNKIFRVFHSTVQAYVDQHKLQEKLEEEGTEIEKVLPEYFFRTAHHIEPRKRVEIQGVCQQYIDHSISSTVNLPESISPETISDIYLYAWKKKLKGLTIYRDGSRFPILSIEQKQEAFKKFKSKKFKVMQVSHEQILYGDEVIVTPDGKLTTPFHALQDSKNPYIIQEVGLETEQASAKSATKDASATACKIEIVDGKLIKSCGE